MGAPNISRTSWRAARNIRRLASLSLADMQAIEPRWAYFEAAEMDLSPDDLRPLLTWPVLALAHGFIAFTILALERRPARVLAAHLGGCSATCISRWRSLGRDVPARLTPRLVLLAHRWPE